MSVKNRSQKNRHTETDTDHARIRSNRWHQIHFSCVRFCVHTDTDHAHAHGHDHVQMDGLLSIHCLHILIPLHLNTGIQMKRKEYMYAMYYYIVLRHGSTTIRSTVLFQCGVNFRRHNLTSKDDSRAVRVNTRSVSIYYSIYFY